MKYSISFELKCYKGTSFSVNWNSQSKCKGADPFLLIIMGFPLHGFYCSSENNCFGLSLLCFRLGASLFQTKRKVTEKKNYTRNFGHIVPVLKDFETINSVILLKVVTLCN